LDTNGAFSKVVQTFVARNTGFIGNAVSAAYQVGAQSLRSSFVGITSWCSTTAKQVSERLSALFDDKVASIRTINPSSVVKRFTSATLSTGKATANPAGEGFQEFADVCEELAGNISTIVSIEATQSVESIRTRLMQYPSAPANSSYERTFALQQGWKAATVSFDTNVSFASDISSASLTADASVSLSNNVPYAKWVQRRATQASIHRGRWNTVEDIAEQETPDLINRIQDSLDQIFSSTN